ncbi:hypothetical protein [Mycobacterium sp.]|uniref:hypothetical protein n=1 Tax=Mycobacterium sp. TaxID=1785 RepID=UPI002BBAEC9A|nr:hypothetical protein [Mycobacterium sp.]HTQ17175.1 hypothetical protein [Mycobacterium sp.]
MVPAGSDPRTPAAAVRASEQAVARVTQLRGSDHPETLVKRAQLARDRAKAGDSQRAIEDYESLLSDLSRVLGRQSEQTLDIGTAQPGDSARAGGAITDYERRLQVLLEHLQATYSPLL